MKRHIFLEFIHLIRKKVLQNITAHFYLTHWAGRICPAISLGSRSVAEIHEYNSKLHLKKKKPVVTAGALTISTCKLSYLTSRRSFSFVY